MPKHISKLILSSLVIATISSPLASAIMNNLDDVDIGSSEIISRPIEDTEVLSGKDAVGLWSPINTSVIFAANKSAAKIKKAKTCKAGYAVNQKTNRCKKLVTITESKTMITTKTWNPKTDKVTTTRTCKSGYWKNPKTDRCNKKKVCSIGYKWISSTNKCQKIKCPIGYKVQDSSNTCKKLICKLGYIINQKTGNCVQNRKGKFKECKDGWTLDLTTSECALIGTKGSNDPASKAAGSGEIMKSANYFSTLTTLKKISTISANIVKIETPAESGGGESTKDCGEGKFLNPKTNRCKSIQTISETSTGKTITTYDPETGEATVTKVCNEGYFLNTETNRCNKVKEVKISSTTKKSTSNEPCPAGKFRNPKTNRCKNIETINETSTGKTVTTYDPKTGEATTKKYCNEGYELNEETNRCKKIKENEGENYELQVPELGSETKNNFIAGAAVAIALSLGVGFIIYQFRHEIAKKVKGLLSRKKA